MHVSVGRLCASLSTAVALASLAACESDGLNNLVVTPLTNPTFVQRNLVADILSYGAVTIDANLVNPWGLAFGPDGALLSLIHISEPTRLLSISYAVFCLKK